MPAGGSYDPVTTYRFAGKVTTWTRLKPHCTHLETPRIGQWCTVNRNWNQFHGYSCQARTCVFNSSTITSCGVNVICYEHKTLRATDPSLNSADNCAVLGLHITSIDRTPISNCCWGWLWRRSCWSVAKLTASWEDEWESTVRIIFWSTVWLMLRHTGFDMGAHFSLGCVH